MFKKILSFVVLLASMSMLTSCLSDDEEEVTYYDDTAVTAFSVSSVVRYLTTTASDGVTDSTYSSTYTASSHRFYIDQMRHEIYNPDSLPYGTDASKIVASLSTKNSGTAVVVYKDNSGADSLAYFSTSDSLDYTEPMQLRVYNMRGTAYRTYTIRVNVHQETGDEFYWNTTATPALASVGARRIVNYKDAMYLFAQSGSQTLAFRETDGGWTQLSQQLSADAYASVIATDDCLYTLSEGNVMQSADGATWTTVAPAANLSRLLGSVEGRLYGLAADAIMVSADNGATWTAQQLDDNASLLPTENINFVVEQTTAGTNTYSLLLVGTRDGSTKVWRKVEDFGHNAEEQPWAYYASDVYNMHTLPVLSGLQIFAYDGSILATGADLSTFYQSKDQGITWIANSDYALPAAFDATAASYAVAVSNGNTIYISGDRQATVWKGRLSRTAWADNQTIFTE